MPDSTLENSLFMRACRKETVERTPVWLMRQAGRYQKTYRELRAKVGFLQLCKSPDLCAEVTVTAVEELGADAAIIFSDILPVLEPLGIGLTYEKGEGPVIARPVRTAADVAALQDFQLEEHLEFVYKAVAKARAALPKDIPLLGFAGAPFTLASYLIEGGSSKEYIHTRALMKDEGAWNALLARLARIVGEHLRLQVEAGCQAVQIFDSWVGFLTEAEYRSLVLPHTKAVVKAIQISPKSAASPHPSPLPKGEGIPVIHFGTKTAHLLPAMAESGASVMGISHDIRLGAAWSKLSGSAVMGNLDPTLLRESKEVIRRETAKILAEAYNRPGHIFNLGHGILPDSPEENVRYLVDTVKELSAR